MNYVMRINAFWRFDNVIGNFSKTFFGKLILAAMVFCIFYALGKILPKAISKAVYKMPNYRDLESSAGVLKAVIKCVNWIMGISVILDVLGLQGVFTKLIASAGIVGMIAGFALKDVTSNSFSGLLIKAEKPFVVGDWVNINSHIGVVREIGTVTVGIETLGGHMAYIPNQNIYNTSFINYSKYGHYRIVVEMGISYGDDLDKVERVAVETLEKLPFVEKPQDVDFYYVNVGSCTYNFNARYLVKYTQQTDMLKAQSEGIKALKTAFEKEDICVAYNVTTLDFSGKGGVNLDETSLKIVMDQK